MFQTRTHSHKSLQCEVASRPNFSEERHTVNTAVKQQRSFETLREIERNSRQEVYQKPSREKISTNWPSFDRGYKVTSKMDLTRERHAENRYREYPPENVPTRTYLNPRDRPPFRDFDRERYEDDRRRPCCEHKTSRSFDVHRDYEEDRCKASTRCESKRFDSKYYERPREQTRNKDHSRRHVERCDRNSVVSRDELRDRDKYSERERDSGLSVADGEVSTVSGRSNYLRVVKVNHNFVCLHLTDFLISGLSREQAKANELTRKNQRVDVIVKASELGSHEPWATGYIKKYRNIRLKVLSISCELICVKSKLLYLARFV